MNAMSRVFALIMLVLAGPALAQNPYSAAWRVNESVITNFDISQRMRLMNLLGGRSDTARADAVEDLINDRLRLDEANALGFALSPEQVDSAVRDFALARNMTAERLLARLAAEGVSEQALREMVGTATLWRAVLRARFGDSANPTEAELNAQLSAIAITSTRTILLGELALPYAERGQEETFELALRLTDELNRGGDWEAAVREFSRAASASQGGVLGWVSPQQLPDQIGLAIRGLGVGAVSEPIFLPSGIVLIKVLDARDVQQQIQVPIKVSVSYAELVLPAGLGGDALRQMLDGCRNLDAVSAATGAGLSRSGLVALNGVAADVGLALARLEPRESAVLAGAPTRVLVLCDRVSEMSEESRAILRNQLLGQRLSALSEGYLLQLRRTSLIEQM